jgi:hypothetical protein
VEEREKGKAAQKVRCARFAMMAIFQLCFSIVLVKQSVNANEKVRQIAAVRLEGSSKVVSWGFLLPQINIYASEVAPFQAP